MDFLTGLVNVKVSQYEEKLHDLDYWAYNFNTASHIYSHILKNFYGNQGLLQKFIFEVASNLSFLY